MSMAERRQRRAQVDAVTRVIAIVAGKGGTGKTTLATALAVLASKQGKAALIDLNEDQANASQWWVDRGRPDNPNLLFDFDNLKAFITGERERGLYNWIVIDTPPIGTGIIEGSIAVADVAVLPSRASVFDLDMVDAILGACDKHHVPCIAALAARDAQRMRKITAEAEENLREAVGDHDIAKIANHVKDDGGIGGTSYRAEYVNAVTVGKSAYETDKAAREEIDALWKQIEAAVQ